MTKNSKLYFAKVEGLLKTRGSHDVQNSLFCTKRDFHHDWTNVKTGKSSRPDYSIRVDDSSRPNECSRPV